MVKPLPSPRRETPAAATASADPRPWVGRLDSLTAVRRELAKLYKLARHGKIATQDAARLCFMLNTLATMIERDGLADRLIALEAAEAARLESEAA